MDELPRIKVNHGLNMAWDALLTLKPEAVCKNALATYDASTSIFSIKSFGHVFQVDTSKKTLTCEDDGGEIFPGKFREYLRLALLWYLASAKDIEPTGRLVKPSTLKGGQIYVSGTHVLPLGEVAESFAIDAQGFIDKGKSLGAELVEGMGDAAIRLYPLPRIPVTMILWLREEEEGFEPETSLLFDSTLDMQVAPDVGWSLATCCCMAMLGRLSENIY